MSNARDLALIEKWADIATPSVPSLSPTSPKPTKLCCCPNRRRYNLYSNRSKKSTTNTLHARNIFVDNDFTYIDDVPQENDSCSNNDSNSNRSGSNCSSNRHRSDYDDIVDITGNYTSNSNSKNGDENDRNVTVILMNEQMLKDQQQQQWRHDKSNLNNSNNNYNKSNTKNSKIKPSTEKFLVNLVAATTGTNAKTKPLQLANAENGGRAEETIEINNAVSEINERGTDSIAENTLDRQQHEDTCCIQKQQKQKHQQQQIQRLSDSELNNSNKENNVSNNNNNNSKHNNFYNNITTTTTSTTDRNNIRCNYCKLQEPKTNKSTSNYYNSIYDNNENSDEYYEDDEIDTNTSNASNINNNSDSFKIDSPNKMTITTTTNVANRKLSECGLSAATNATSTAASPPTSPTLVRPATPSRLKTVIKTTMVKRSPSNDSTTTATTTTATPTSPYGVATTCLPFAANNDNSNITAESNIDECCEPRRSVRERIAAFAAGNEQTKNHDNANKFKIQCNKNQKTNNNNITNEVNSAISKKQEEQHNQPPINSNNSKCISTVIASPTAPAAPSQSASTANGGTTTASNVNIARYKSGLNDAVASFSATTEDEPTLEATSTAIATSSASTSKSISSAMPTTSTLLRGGCSTMPRRRSPALAANERCYNLDRNSNNHINNSNNGDHINGKYGSNATTATRTTHVDKKLLNCTSTPKNGDKESMDRKLTALDNLDLATRSFDLMDEEGEDPYFALQEYLERVKHEINEVFELRKAQKMQQQQQQQPNGQPTKTYQAAKAMANTTSTTVGVASVDELSRSTESDSGFDSATGGHIGSKLQIKAAANNVNGGVDFSVNSNNNNYANRTTTTTKLRALSPPPLSPNKNSRNNTSVYQQQQQQSTLGRLRQTATSDSSSTATAMNVGTSAPATYVEAAADDVNIWANKFLRDLDNLMASDKPTTSTSASTSPTSSTSPMLLSAAASAAIQSRYGKSATSNQNSNEQQPLQNCPTNGLLLKPEKHTTIPLQSFNLDCGRSDASKSNVAYMRTLSAPAPYQQQLQQKQQNDNKSSFSLSGTVASGKNNRNSLATFNATTITSDTITAMMEQQQKQQHQQQHHLHSPHHNLTNVRNDDDDDAATILKIEESSTLSAITSEQRQQQLPTITKTVPKSETNTNEQAALLKSRRQQHQLENDMETIRNALLSQLDRTTNDSSSGSGSRNTSSLVASAMAASPLPKREHIDHALNAMMTTKTTSTTKTSLLNGKIRDSVSPTPPSTSASLTSSKIHGGCINSYSNNLNNTTTPSYLLNGSDVTKKGSTSTIWTSEESILRSVGAVDEDNNSTSSSACDEAAGVLSSGKSGVSLDSSGLDNDNNESGIGTATPPKDMSYWKNVNNDNESISSLDALRKMKFQKSSSVVSSDDPDLLEVLSLCDEPHVGNDETVGSHDDITDEQKQQLEKERKKQARHTHHNHNQHRRHHRRQCRQHDNDDSNNVAVEAVDDFDIEAEEERANDVEAEIDVDGDEDEDDEGHDEFQTIPYCDCECTDGDASSASGGTSSSHLSGGPTLTTTSNEGIGSSSSTVGTGGSVVLRRKYAAAPIMVPFGSSSNNVVRGAPKCRSHSLDTSSLPSTYQHYPQQHHLQHQHHHHFHHGLAPISRKLQPLHTHRTTKERGQLSLALRQEPFQSLLSPTHFHELPSPSSASLHSGHESLGIQELTTKSNSAPLLLKQEQKNNDFAGQNLTLRYSRSQSDRYLAEIEAVEACKWLRAAGFPQYAQMYEDHQFPIDLTNVAKDHTNLENDQLQSLYRRLCILNRCANMRLDQSHKPQTPQQKDESDDENFALSENWTFQPHIRRWSRIGEMGLELPPAGKLNLERTESSSKESSPDRFEDDAYDVSGGITLMLPGAGKGDGIDSSVNESAEAAAVRLRRTGSERFKDGAKAFLRRVESIKSRRRKRQNRENVVISGPQVLDLSQLGQRNSMRKPDAVYSTPPSPSAVSPMHTFPKSPFFGNELKVPSHSENFLSPNRSSPKRTPTTPRSMRTSPLHFFSSPMPHLKEGKSDDSSSYYSDSQESSTGGKLSLRKTPSKARRFLQRTGKVDDIGTHSDSECHHGRKLLIKDANSNTTEVKIKKLTRGGSLNLGKDPKKRDGFRSSSFRSRSTTRKENKPESDEHIKRTPVVRWHSFQMEARPNMIFRKCFSQKIEPTAEDDGIPFGAMSAGQLQIIRKLALVVLTGYMERYCPSHRSGWNWELPKFIKKIKMPDYRDKKVFGVPLLLILQRSGQTLPIAVRSAFRWLQLNALDQTGLFRKSGVKSRIIKLKELIEYSESTLECMDVFDTQQAYDVADMLKQYFRDLPESLLTTKMSETFVAIFQHLPPDVRLDAVQCAVLLLPDENREILYALLEFLTLVAANAQLNQMTANNLAVCLAPSLFHSSISTGTASVSASPRRRKGAGVPDVKELSEAKASHECLAFMIDNYKQIFTASKEKLSKCNFGYMEESKPVPLEALGEGMQFHNWRGYLYECTSATIKEGREKTRGWFTITSLTDPNVEIAYKKVGDGHPLRLWRCITEIEGPPKEVLDYITKQRASWDANLLQSQTVKKLDERTEIFQYALDGQMTTDFCVLRSWQTDLPRGACVIVETSIDNAKAKMMYGAVRGVVLASRYLIEPCGSGRSRVMHLARVDIKGKTPEWYNKSYGHICSHYLSKIRLAFKNVTEGPESKV